MRRARGRGSGSHGRGRGQPSRAPRASAFDQVLHSQFNNQDEHHPGDLGRTSAIDIPAGPPSIDTVASLLNRNISKYVEISEQLENQNPTGFNNGQAISEVPTAEEMLTQVRSEDFAAHNKISGPWRDEQTYLETHYKLLREDSVRPLREAIATFRTSPAMHDDKDLAIYEKVHIIGITLANKGVAMRIRFSIARAGKKILWDNSKRLISGSMVALSPATDNFRTKCIIATVAARPLDGVQTVPPEIDIFFARAEELELDPQMEFVMIEARSGYYEATRHVMKAIQKLNTERFPFSSQLVSLDQNVDAPNYLQENSLYNLTSVQDTVAEIDILKSWPPSPPKGSELDKSQWSALYRILGKELAIIQGPPGTGKTYVSVTALKLLLANRKLNDPPIIVAAHTNHALDQLLRHIRVFEKNYIRLGGRSTDDEIKRRTLFEVRQKLKTQPPRGGSLPRAMIQHKALVNRMIKTLAPLICDRDQKTSILTAQVFEELGLLSKEQVESLDTGAARWTEGDITQETSLELWLEKSVIPFSVTYRDGDFGFQDETESETDQEYEQLKELEAEQGIEGEDDDFLHGTYKSITDGWTVPRGSHVSATAAQKYLDTHKDLWTIPASVRGGVYLYLQRASKAQLCMKFRSQAGEYSRLVRDIQIGKWERDSIVLQTASIVGMTMTGLSKYRPLVAGIRPKIILIEESAEVLEGPVAVACLESLEHLILVGDHQQLQPSTSVSQLAKPPFNLQVSLFERLVTNRIPFNTLTRQRRMDPEFRLLLKPFYSNLEDHPSVLNRPKPLGCKHKLWMFTHRWPESTDSSFSKLNEREALMVAGFFQYLVRNGIPIHGITVMTFYNGQRKLILRELRKRLPGSYINVVTVDSYQGEENAIILLSLVRSAADENKSIGFCGIPNRVCVALSRARLGFYMFGRADQLYEASTLWKEILKLVISGQGQDDKRAGYHLPLTCTRHNRETSMEQPGDFDKFNSGCDLKCSDKLDCGHPCPHKCHPYKHSEIICPAKCERSLPCGHACQLLCGESPCACPCDAFARLSITEDPPTAHPTAVNAQTFTRPVNRAKLDPPGPTWISRNDLISRHATQSKRTPCPKQNTLKNQSPERWNEYADGAVVQDDQRLEGVDDHFNINRRDALKPLGPRVLSADTKPIENGSGAYRTRYKEEYVPMPSSRIGGHNLDGESSSLVTDEPLIEL